MDPNSKCELQILVAFATSYLCEAEFSATAIITTKYRSRIDAEKEMRLAVAKIFLRFHDLGKSLQAHMVHN